MKISMQMSVVMATIFAAICFGVAVYGFASLGEIADPAQRADGAGFAWFWTFLGAVAAGLALLGRWFLKTGTKGTDA